MFLSCLHLLPLNAFQCSICRGSTTIYFLAIRSHVLSCIVAQVWYIGTIWNEVFYFRQITFLGISGEGRSRYGANVTESGHHTTWCYMLSGKKFSIRCNRIHEGKILKWIKTMWKNIGLRNREIYIKTGHHFNFSNSETSLSNTMEPSHSLLTGSKRLWEYQNTSTKQIVFTGKIVSLQATGSLKL